MSCVNCDKCQEQGACTYIRVGASNVEISGCEEHLIELIRIFRLGLEQDKKENS